MFRSLRVSESKRQHLSSSEKTAPREQGGSQAVYKFATKGEGSLIIKDQVSSKGIKHSVYGKMQASGLAEFIPFIGTSAIWGQPCPLVHLASCIPPAPQQSLWGMVASAGSVFLETSFTFGGQKSLMVVTFLVDQYGRRYFHFTKVC